MFKPQLIPPQSNLPWDSSCIQPDCNWCCQIVMNNTLFVITERLLFYGSDIPIACVGIVSKVNMVFFAICIGIARGLCNLSGALAMELKSTTVFVRHIVILQRHVTIICHILFSVLPDLFHIRRLSRMFGGGSDPVLLNSQKIITRDFYAPDFPQMVSSQCPPDFCASIGRLSSGIIMSLTRPQIFLLPLIIIFPYVFRD